MKGISTGDFSEALAAALLGKDAAALSASAIGRLKDGWLDEHAAWQKRDLLAKRFGVFSPDSILIVALQRAPEGAHTSKLYSSANFDQRVRRYFESVDGVYGVSKHERK